MTPVPAVDTADMAAMASLLAPVVELAEGKGYDLFHFTCSDRRTAIAAEGVVHPYPQPALGGLAMSWWTDLDLPFREALGLTSRSLACDRTAHRFAATDLAAIHHWPAVRRDLPVHLRRAAVDLEWADGAMPMHWWVSLAPVPVVES